MVDLLEGVHNLYGFDGVWGYLVVFVLAVIPWIEVLVIVPAAVGLGFNPALVAVVAFAGNMVPVLGISSLNRKLRFPAPAYFRSHAERVWNRHGVPGVALIAPTVTGVYLTMSVGLALDAPRRRLVGWMALSLALWTAGLAAATYLGLRFVTG